MKKFNKMMMLLLAAVMLGIGGLQAQTVIIGTGGAASSTFDASPINIWYRSLRYQVVYTAAELSAAGASAGSIVQMGFNITNAPLYALPDFKIEMKHTTAADASAHDGVGLQQVYYVPSYTPVAGGFDMLTLQTPFAWNGTDNILIDVCFAQVVPTYNQSGGVSVFTATNAARFVRNDNSNQCGAATSATLAQKPVVQFVLGSAPSCSMTSLPTATNITTATANLSWTHPGTPASYLIEYGLQGTPAGAGTFVSTTSTNYTVTGLNAASDYVARVFAVCGTAAGDTSFAALVYFSTACPSTLTAPITESFNGAGVDCLTSANGVLTSGGGWPNFGWVASASSFYSAPQGYDAGAFLYFETQGASPGSNDTLFFSPIDLTPLTNPFLDFFWYLDYQWTGSGSFDVQIGNASGNWVSVFSRSGGQNIFDWTYASVDLSAYAGTTVGLRIVGVASGGYEGGAGIDRLRVKEAPASLCAIQPTPLVLDFENAGALNACWEQSTDDVFNWTVFSGATPSAGTGPNGASAGTYYAYIETSGAIAAGDSAILVSPPMNTSTLTDAPAVYFDYHMFGNDYMRLRVEYEIFGSEIWVPVWEQEGAVQTAATDDYAAGYIPLPNAIGSTIRVRFIAVAGANDGVSTGAGLAWASDIAIDNVRIANVLANDVAVTAITSPGNSCGLGVEAVTVQITNIGFNDQNSVPVFLSVNGGTPVGLNTGLILGNGGTTSVTALVDMTNLGEYEIVAYTALNADEDTDNDEFTEMALHQPQVTGDYEEGFEMGTGYWAADGEWEQGEPSATIINGASAGMNAFVTNLTGNYTDAKTSYLTSPCFDVSSMTAPVLRFSINWDTEDDWDGAWLEYSTSGGQTWEKLGANGFAGQNWYTDSISNNATGWSWNGSSNGWVDAIIDLQPYGLDVVTDVRFRFVFAADASTVQEGVGVDNFGIYDGCLKAVANETLTNVSKDGLTDGAIVLSPVGGFGGYTFNWSNGATTNSISNLAVGTYSVTISDAFGCSTTKTFDIISTCPATLGISTTINPEIGDNEANGAASIIATNGVAPYTYSWSNGTTGEYANGLAAGTYNVVVTDANGCTETTTITVETVYMVGTENLEGLTNLILAPNPAKDFAQLNINFDRSVDLTVRVIDVTGRVLETRNAGNTMAQEMRFDLANFAEGVYFMQIIANNQTATKRFVVVK